MPNRIVREGIVTSEALALVSPQAECLFYRLLVVADDFGAFDGRAVVVRARCLALRDSTVADVEAWLRELAEHALIVQYEVKGQPYLAIPKFGQRTRAKASKFPLPDNWRSIDGQVSDHGQSSAHGDGGGGGDVFGIGGDKEGAAPPAQPPVVLLPLNDGGEYGVKPEQVREWADLYRAIDVEAQLRAMRGWLLANAANRKTRSGIDRFINRWLSQEQNKAAKAGGAAPAHNPAVPRGKPAVDSESPLEKEVNLARHKLRMGWIDSDECQRLIAEATAKHRRAA